MTPKQELFCQEYLIDCNGAAAAKRAGYSLHSANDYAAELLAKDEIRDRIEHLMMERSRRVGVNQDFVLHELVGIARAGSGMEKVRALELLGKHLHLFNDRIDVDITLAKKAEEFQKLDRVEQLKLLKEAIQELEAPIATNQQEAA